MNVHVQLNRRKNLLPDRTCRMATAMPVMFGLALAMQLHAQTDSAHATATPPVFEVATIKPSDPLNGHESIRVLAGGRFQATVTLKSLIERSYGLRDFQVLGGPKWLESAKYDIDAKSDDPEDPSRLTSAQQDALWARQQQRLQSLLADRFRMRFHSAKKEVPVYALLVAKDGPKLRTPKAGEPHRLYSQSPGQLACYGASMSEFAAEFQDLGVSRIVIDKTGLSGSYDFALRWTPEDPQSSGLSGGGTGNDNAAASEASAPLLFTALQEQLGLKLEAQKGLVDVIVIDSIEKPSPN
jgi:bla regulator protein blaR1